MIEKITLENVFLYWLQNCDLITRLISTLCLFMRKNDFISKIEMLVGIFDE